MKRSLPTVLPFLFAGWLLSALPVAAQTPPPKASDPTLPEQIALLKAVVNDKKMARDAEGLPVIDTLLQKLQAGVEPKEQKEIVKAFEGVLKDGKLRPSDKTELYVGAATALGYCGPDGAKVLRAAFQDKRFPSQPEWVRLREHFLKNLGRTKDESMVKLLINEARRNHVAALQAAAGEALGNYEESGEALRKEIVSELLTKYGELAELASQLGTNVEAQNAQDRLAAVADKWNTTLAKLTRQNFGTFREWQVWYNKHKGQPW